MDSLYHLLITYLSTSSSITLFSSTSSSHCLFPFLIFVFSFSHCTLVDNGQPLEPCHNLYLSHFLLFPFFSHSTSSFHYLIHFLFSSYSFSQCALVTNGQPLGPTHNLPIHFFLYFLFFFFHLHHLPFSYLRCISFPTVHL